MVLISQGMGGYMNKRLELGYVMPGQNTSENVEKLINKVNEMIERLEEVTEGIFKAQADFDMGLSSLKDEVKKIKEDIEVLKES